MDAKGRGSPNSLSAVGLALKLESNSMKTWNGQANSVTPTTFPLLEGAIKTLTTPINDIPFDRIGWINEQKAFQEKCEIGALKPLAILFARDVEFVELELESVPHAHIEARIEDIRVKAGLEALERESVIRTERGWRVRFRGPQKRRWRQGIQALLVAVVPPQFLAADSTPWKLHSIRWQNNSP